MHRALVLALPVAALVLGPVFFWLNVRSERLSPLERQYLALSWSALLSFAACVLIWSWIHHNQQHQKRQLASAVLTFVLVSCAVATQALGLVRLHGGGGGGGAGFALFVPGLAACAVFAIFALYTVLTSD